MRRCIVLIAVCALAGIAAVAQVASVPQAQSEQHETGIASVPGSPSVHYTIRLLPVSSFPQLPATVAAQLTRMGCMIPQTFEAHQPENVINGAFKRKGSSDWAALCSERTSPRFTSSSNRTLLIRSRCAASRTTNGWALNGRRTTARPGGYRRCLPM